MAGQAGLALHAQGFREFGQRLGADACLAQVGDQLLTARLQDVDAQIEAGRLHGGVGHGPSLSVAELRNPVLIDPLGQALTLGRWQPRQGGELAGEPGPLALGELGGHAVVSHAQGRSHVCTAAGVRGLTPLEARIAQQSLHRGEVPQVGVNRLGEKVAVSRPQPLVAAKGLRERLIGRLGQALNDSQQSCQLVESILRCSGFFHGASRPRSDAVSRAEKPTDSKPGWGGKLCQAPSTSRCRPARTAITD